MIEPNYYVLKKIVKLFITMKSNYTHNKTITFSHVAACYTQLDNYGQEN